VYNGIPTGNRTSGPPVAGSFRRCRILPFVLIHCCKDMEARAGVLHTAHGTLPTPAFLPVATQATVKAIAGTDLRSLGVPGILSNAYHLVLRPGLDVIAQHGGIHSFMRWNGPIVVDSGGFQVFSLAPLVTMDAEGVTFRSHLDGSERFFSPEELVRIHGALGSDIGMILDVCTPYEAEEKDVRRAVERTLEWAERSKRIQKETPLFAIVQGGVFPGLRRFCANALVTMDFPGYAIGGLSVGEPREEARAVLAETIPLLPVDRARYVMGVGTPQELLEYVSMGVDFFDCALPTRNARNGSIFTASGKLAIRNASFAGDLRPLDESCPCWVCENFTRSYIRHLFVAKEILAAQLATWHNVSFFCRLMRGARQAILRDDFARYKESWMEKYQWTD